MAGEVDEPRGSARLELASGVRLLHEDDAVVEAMLEGWAKQQLGGRGLAPKTVERRRVVVRQFLDFTNEYPWNWTAAHLDEWSADLVGARGRAKSTMRNFHDAIRSFESYILSPHYGWVQECEARFGTYPVRICFESNTTAHRSYSAGASVMVGAGAACCLDLEDRPGRVAPCRMRRPTSSCWPTSWSWSG